MPESVFDAAMARRLAEQSQPARPDVSRFLAIANAAIREAVDHGRFNALVQFGQMVDTERADVVRTLQGWGYRVELSGFEVYPAPYVISW